MNQQQRQGPQQGPHVPYDQPAAVPHQRAPQPPRPARMPKAQALTLTKRLKTALIAGSVMAFGVLTALAAGHLTGVTATAAGANSTTAPSSASNADNNGGFFNQQPSDDNGNTGSFGVSPNAPTQQPAASSSVS
jgi:hypothetical protein